MATLAHCAYCFESLSASFDKRKPTTLQRIEELWSEYIASHESGDTTAAAVSPKAGSVSRLLNRTDDDASPSSSSTVDSSFSTPAQLSSNSSTSSLPRTTAHESHPLFITWNTISTRSGHKSLRGCIGCFTPLRLPEGLHDYALTAAFEDHRFNPIPASSLPSLQVCVTLLTNFSSPDKDPLNWTIGEHGIRLSFSEKGRRYGATYLPDVALQQGWTKEEAILSLMRKAGWNGKDDQWRTVSGLEIVRYEGNKVHLDYGEWKKFRSWIDEQSRC